ncbi:polysaccharide biosynthesis protein [Hydrogenoanaerobacterium sp.]|uniref:putative polysaccharide biosynthesis protein n=1 Tax=Hydrogenoanaerobacterium sp. TaxID=2953763 RepID=UPI00289EEC4E|nr:polysaccharide biosynthesis protein [Hydrogenoanaerobacterium sp.]
MSAKKKQTFLQGAMILLAATVLVKVIGVLFKMPLTNIIGATGMGYFNIAYGLFNTLYALSVAGLPVAVAKMVAENSAAHRFRDVRRIHHLSTLAFLITGSLGTLIMFFGAKPYVQFNKNQDALYAVAVMAPAILFVCLTSSFRGYYEGLRNMYPTAVSQVVEAAGKLVFGMWFATYMMQKGLAEYEQLGTVFGRACASMERARLDVLPFAAAGAIAGIAASTILGTLYLWLRHHIVGDGITHEELQRSPEAASRRVLMRRLIRIAVPVCLGSLVLNITTIIDISSITNRLSTALTKDSTVILGMYSGAIPPAMEISGIPNFLYGTYTMAVTIFNLVPAITTTFGVSALPIIASAWATHNRHELTRGIESVLRITSMVAFPAGCGLFALAQPILMLLYPGEAASVQIAVPMLRILGIAVMFVSLATPVNSMLQAIGKVNVPVKLMLIGGVLKLTTNYIFIADPNINIQVAPYGTLICYAFILLFSVPILCRSAQTSISLVQTFFKPLLAAVLCGICAWVTYGLLTKVFGETLSTLAAITIAGVFYVVCLFLLHAIVKDDILMLPNGEKIVKTLEKRGLIR